MNGDWRTEHEGDVDAAERMLRRDAKEARRRGAKLAWGTFDSIGPRGERQVCVMGAHNMCAATTNDRLPLPTDDAAFVAAYDAIEVGFDDKRQDDHPFAWWDLGRRLRRSLQPRKARGE